MAQHTLRARRYSWSQMSISASPWTDKERSCWMQWEKQLHWPHFVIVWKCHRNTLAKIGYAPTIYEHIQLFQLFFSLNAKKKKKKECRIKGFTQNPMYIASGVVSTLYVLTLWFACAAGGRLYDATERYSPGDAFQIFPDVAATVHSTVWLRNLLFHISVSWCLRL